MSIPRRFQWSFGLVVVAAFVVAVADMLFSIGLVDHLLSPWLVVPAFVVAWLLAPWAAQRLPFK